MGIAIGKRATWVFKRREGGEGPWGAWVLSRGGAMGVTFSQIDVYKNQGIKGKRREYCFNI